MNPSQDPRMFIRQGQFLVGGLIAGLTSFSAVTAYLVLSGNSPVPTGAPSTSFLLIAMGVLTLATTAASFAIAAMTVSGLRKQSDSRLLDEDTLFPRFLTTVILRGALAEGPAFFGTIIVLITGSWVGFAGSTWGLLLLLLVFPTRDRFDSFFRNVTGRSSEI
jgi:hypothetical protein